MNTGISTINIKNRHNSTWTPEEDAALLQGIERYGKMWSVISALILPQKNQIQCRKRYTNTLHPTISFSPWTTAEDEKLMAGVHKFGRQWSHFAKSLPGRTALQCSNRYSRVLDPKLNRSRWTSEEDNILIQEVESKGKKWTLIAQNLPGRTGPNCCTRYRNIEVSKKAKQAKNAKKRTFNESISCDSRSAEENPSKKLCSEELRTLTQEKVIEINENFFSLFYNSKQILN